MATDDNDVKSGRGRSPRGGRDAPELQRTIDHLTDENAKLKLIAETLSRQLAALRGSAAKARCDD